MNRHVFVHIRLYVHTNIHMYINLSVHIYISHSMTFAHANRIHFKTLPKTRTQESPCNRLARLQLQEGVRIY